MQLSNTDDFPGFANMPRLLRTLISLADTSLPSAELSHARRITLVVKRNMELNERRRNLIGYFNEHRYQSALQANIGLSHMKQQKLSDKEGTIMYFDVHGVTYYLDLFTGYDYPHIRIGHELSTTWAG